jgi:hypothetical protein
MGQGAKLSVNKGKVGKVTKAESGGGATSQSPKAGSWWIAELVSGTEGGTQN